MINKKIKDKKGITIIYALLGIMVFVMVGIVIFNAATANYNRHIRERDYQQSFLSISSAADVFIDSIAGDKITFTTKTVIEGESSTTTEDTVDKWQYVEYEETSSLPTTLTDSLATKIIEMVYSRYANADKTLAVNKKFVISADFTGDDDQIRDTYVDLSLDHYNLVAKFTNYDPTSDTKPANALSITATIPYVSETGDIDEPAEEDVEETIDEETGDSTIITTYKIEWDAGNITIERGI